MVEACDRREKPNHTENDVCPRWYTRRRSDNVEGRPAVVPANAETVAAFIDSRDTYAPPEEGLAVLDALHNVILLPAWCVSLLMLVG